MTGLPDHYFRIKDNGALVFRVDIENRQRRLELDQIAAVNVNNGQVKAHGEEILTPEDEAAIAAWMQARRATLAERESKETERLLERIALTAQWAQARASEEELDAITDRLLLAMHDLRTVLVKKRADRMLGD